MPNLENYTAVARFSDDNIGRIPGEGTEFKSCTIKIINNSSYSLLCSHTTIKNDVYTIEDLEETIEPNTEKTVTSLYYCESSTDNDPYYKAPFYISLNDIDPLFTWSEEVNCEGGEINVSSVTITNPLQNSSITLTASD